MSSPAQLHSTMLEANNKAPPDDAPLEVAIVGGGITGLTLALGLLKRDISFKIYERAHGFREIGAGIGFTPNAERAMTALDPRIHEAFRKLYLGERGFEGCRRPDFLEEIVNHIPDQYVHFDKDLVSTTERGENEKLLLSFRDGSSATADVVIGCDGIHSKMRRLMLGDKHPACNQSYSHKYAIRGLIPMDKARAAIGEFKTSNRLMHFGPNAHAVTFPVAGGTILNVVAFVTDPGEWAAPDGKSTAPATKSEATQAFSTFSPVVRRLMNLLPDQLDKWAVFDTRHHPVPSYVSDRLCLAGDAAHASSPHHGAGAGCGIEDCLALAVLLETAAQQAKVDQPTAVRVALQAHNTVRYERSQWLVDSSRIIGDVYEFRDPDCGSNHKKIAHEIYSRTHKIRDYDVNAMVEDALDQFGKQMKEAPSFAVTNMSTSSVNIPLVHDQPVAHAFLSGFKLTVIMASFTVVYFLMMLDMSILSTLFHTSPMTSILFSIAELQPLTGKMYARLNSKVIFLCFFAVFNIGSALCGSAQSSPMLIIGRAVAGMGGAGLMNGGFTILHSCVEPRRRPGMLGFMMNCKR
ncbi:FAD/NAD(P)-binding domain-containing protein [Pleomassaria siparia CBS 279.74]|uniref:FAD/NAD(P)-binding domain-containing protein n=1 Tax=Pleomassaria siparia CBS 279.74 TaxID=1314801 RepID=A0A6G1KN55_9PLEO|nr:FAD/NAD(P)-binding domain-containing protein [Pleomassaria siparia CBS 279.74]